MSKYDRLTSFLRASGPPVRRMRFQEIEKILGISLPASARSYPAWWANDPSRGRHSNAWLSAGWETEDVDIGGEAVSFRRRETSDRAGAATFMPPPPPPPPLPVNASPQPEGEAVRVLLEMRWKRLGTVRMKDQERLQFPDAPDEPAIYRLSLVGEEKDRRYIGETSNLRRRFRNYRNPAPSQMTSLRINRLLRDHIDSGGRVDVDIVAGSAALTLAENAVQVDLAEKSMRRLLESAAIIAEGAAEIDSLNL